jgi:hypothetical protein
MIKIIYIAGPYRGADMWIVNCNIHKAETAARMIAGLGAMPLSPHSLTARMSGVEAEKFWISGTLELMRRCDAVFVLSGWRASEGTKGEIAEAERVGLPMFWQDTAADLDRLRLWISWAPTDHRHVPGMVK